MSLRAALWETACILSLAAGCSDHPYRHEVRGRVLSGGAPLEGAVVQRVNADGEAYGSDEVYRRTTAADGSFVFINEGRGPKPLAHAPWLLRVGHEGFAERTLEVHAKWSEGGVCFGYCATDFAIELAPLTQPSTAPSVSAK